MKYYFLIVVFSGFLLSGQEHSEFNKDDRFRLAFNAGFAYRTGAISDDVISRVRDYLKTQKTGYGLGIDATYFIKPQWGLGVKYMRFGSNDTANGIELTFADGSTAYGNLTENVGIDFFGGTYVTRTPLMGGKHRLSGDFAVGYMKYSNNANVVGFLLRSSGETFGGAFDLGYDYRISKSLSAGLQLGYVLGFLKEINVEGGGGTSQVQLDGEEREDLSFLNIGGGLRLVF